MSTHIKFILIFAVTILAAIAVWVAFPRRSETVALGKSSPTAQPRVVSPSVGIKAAQTNVKTETEPQGTEVQLTTQPAAQPKHGVAKKGPKRTRKKVALQDPTARVALGLVGVDPDAETY